MDKLVGKTFTAEVTQSDIDLGCELDAGNCPMARALHKLMYNKFGDRYDGNLSVSSHMIFFYITGHKRARFVFTPSDKILDWIWDFDARHDVDPMTISLNISNQMDNGKSTTFSGKADII